MWLLSTPYCLSSEESWVVLIGVGNCKGAQEVELAPADALLERIGYKPEHIELLTDDTLELDLFPISGNARRPVQYVAEVAERGYSIRVFFSRHGFGRSRQGWLAPTEGYFDYAISITGIRDTLSHPKAGGKILILVPCQAGSAKAPNSIAPDPIASTRPVMLPSQNHFPLLDTIPGRNLIYLVARGRELRNPAEICRNLNKVKSDEESFRRLRKLSDLVCCKK